MSAEWNALNNIDRRREQRKELSPMMLRAHEKARTEVLSNPDYVIQTSEFTDAYGVDRIRADTKEAARLEALFERDLTPELRNSKKIAETLEAIVLMQSEMSEWLGNATTLKTASFDDYKNKVDMLAEWYSPKEGSRLLALAVDVTFGKAPSQINCLLSKKK